MQYYHILVPLRVQKISGPTDVLYQHILVVIEGLKINTNVRFLYILVPIKGQNTSSNKLSDVRFQHILISFNYRSQNKCRYTYKYISIPIIEAKSK